MNKIKTMLVDDELRGLTSLERLLQLNCTDVNVVCSCTGANEAKNKIAELQPELVFLDIAMPGKTGFDLLKELPEINFEIIFVTAHNSYMIQAFHFSAVDYLLKPVEDDLLIEAVKRASKRIRNKTDWQHIQTFMYNIQHKGDLQKMKFCIHSLKGFQVVEINEIIYCEASSNYTNFYFTNRPSICTSKPIHEYEEQLGNCNFVRVHKSFMVNLEHIKEYIRGEGGSLILNNGIEVEVSRRKKDMLMTKMKNFYKF